MAAPMPTRRGSQVTCIIHVCNKNLGDPSQFTQKSWTRVCEFGKKWLELDGPEQQVAEQRRDLFQKGGYRFSLALFRSSLGRPRLLDFPLVPNYFFCLVEDFKDRSWLVFMSLSGKIGIEEQLANMSKTMGGGV